MKRSSLWSFEVVKGGVGLLWPFQNQYLWFYPVFDVLMDLLMLDTSSCCINHKPKLHLQLTLDEKYTFTSTAGRQAVSTGQSQLQVCLHQNSRILQRDTGRRWLDWSSGYGSWNCCVPKVCYATHEPDSNMSLVRFHSGQNCEFYKEILNSIR